MKDDHTSLKKEEKRRKENGLMSIFKMIWIKLDHLLNATTCQPKPGMKQLIYSSPSYEHNRERKSERKRK
jgi:hypothetical protein